MYKIWSNKLPNRVWKLNHDIRGCITDSQANKMKIEVAECGQTITAQASAITRLILDRTRRCSTRGKENLSTQCNLQLKPALRSDHAACRPTAVFALLYLFICNCLSRSIARFIIRGNSANKNRDCAQEIEYISTTRNHFLWGVASYRLSNIYKMKYLI